MGIFSALNCPDQVGNIPRRGVFCAGRVLAGQVRVGDQLEAGYQGNVCRATVKDLEIYRRGAEWLQAGDRGGMFVKLKPDTEMKRGAVVHSGKLKLEWRETVVLGLTAVPGAGPVTIKGESVLYCGTQTDGKVATGQVRLTVNSAVDQMDWIKTCRWSWWRERR